MPEKSAALLSARRRAERRRSRSDRGAACERHDTATTSAASEPAPLSFPVRVYYPSPTQATRNIALPAEQVDERFVEVQFTVTDSGDVSDAKVTEANGTPREAADTLQRSAPRAFVRSSSTASPSQRPA